MNEKLGFAHDWAEVDKELQMVEVISLFVIYKKDQRCNKLNVSLDALSAKVIAYRDRVELRGALPTYVTTERTSA